MAYIEREQINSLLEASSQERKTAQMQTLLNLKIEEQNKAKEQALESISQINQDVMQLGLRNEQKKGEIKTQFDNIKNLLDQKQDQFFEYCNNVYLSQRSSLQEMITVLEQKQEECEKNIQEYITYQRGLSQLDQSEVTKKYLLADKKTTVQIPQNFKHFTEYPNLQVNFEGLQLEIGNLKFYTVNSNQMNSSTQQNMSSECSFLIKEDDLLQKYKNEFNTKQQPFQKSIRHKKIAIKQKTIESTLGKSPFSFFQKDNSFINPSLIFTGQKQQSQDLTYGDKFFSLHERIDSEKFKSGKTYDLILQKTKLSKNPGFIDDSNLNINNKSNRDLLEEKIQSPLYFLATMKKTDPLQTNGSSYQSNNLVRQKNSFISRKNIQSIIL